ncbi:MAG: TerB family tellurite resistance protein [Bdellovibrionales bacterium]|nr:TerB family tellurite resistance protein [Bdellovibrionales bacterium]
MGSGLIKNTWEYFEKGAPLELDKEGNPTIQDIQLGTLFLLGEMSAVDGDFSASEFREVVDSMEEVFNLQEKDLLTLLERADEANKQEEKREKFLTALVDRFNEEQRMLILTLVWRVVFSDGHLRKEELELAEKFRLRLKLSALRGEEARDLAKKQILPAKYL